MALEKISVNGNLRAVVSGSTVTVSTRPNMTTDWPAVSLCLCNQNDPNLPSTLPNPLPTSASYLIDHVDNLTITNGVFSYSFANLSSKTYLIVAIKMSGGAKVVAETDNIASVSVP